MIHNPDTVSAATPPPHEPVHRSPVFIQPRRRGLGVVILALLAAGVGAVLMSNYCDERPLGARLDASVQAGKDGLKSQVQAVQGVATGVATEAANRVSQATDDVGQAMSDSAITAAVKTALAADPSLSAVKIDVTTDNGIVRMDGPAPDEQSRKRRGAGRRTQGRALGGQPPGRPRPASANLSRPGGVSAGAWPASSLT